MDRYADTPMDFADACVTRMAEIHGSFKVCTTDSDFLVYRINRSEPISLLAPFSE
jgi:predicted nucleic acid-binding protein